MKTAHGLNWKAAAALFALLVLSLVLPGIFAPIAAIAFLYVLPGYLLVKILGVKLEPLEAFAISLLGSVMLSAFAIYWLSLLLGYSTATFALFFAIVSAASLFVREMPSFSVPKGVLLPLGAAAASGLIVFIILQLTLWAPSANGVITGAWNYGDYFLHVSVMQSVNHGNFPPQEPIYAGEPLRYHWFIDLHTAIVSKLLEIFPSFPSRVDSALGVALFSLLSYLVALHFTKDRRASLLCALLVVFGGGFGYLRLWDATGTAPLTQLLSSDAFDNKGDFFQVPSMLPGFLLVQRPLTMGLPALAAVLLLVATGYPQDKRRLALAGIILGVMAPFQYYAFLSAALLAALYFAYHYAAKRKTGDLKNALLFVVLPSAILAAPFLLDALGRAGGMTHVALFWLAPVFAGAPKSDPVAFAKFFLGNLGFNFLIDNALAFVKFYIGNLGLPLLLAVPGYFLLRQKGKSFLPLGILLIFLIPSLFTFSNTQWDMAKFFMCEWLLICILAGVALARLPDWLVPLLLLFCCLSPILASVFYLTSGWTGLSNDEIAAGQWILGNTPERSVFASSAAHNTPIDSVGGRLRVLGYHWWVTNYGLDFDSRYNDLRQLYCGPRENAASLMRKYNATYAYVSGSEVQEWGCTPDFNVTGFTLEYSSQSIRIYRLGG